MYLNIRIVHSPTQVSDSIGPIDEPSESSSWEKQRCKNPVEEWLGEFCTILLWIVAKFPCLFFIPGLTFLVDDLFGASFHEIIINFQSLFQLYTDRRQLNVHWSPRLDISTRREQTNGTCDLCLVDELCSEEFCEFSESICFRQRVLGISVPDSVDYFALDLRDFVLGQAFVLLFAATCRPTSQQIFSCVEMPNTGAVRTPEMWERKIEESVAVVTK